VTEVHAWTDRPVGGEIWSDFAVRGRPEEIVPVPPTLDWDLWIGGSDMRAFSPDYVPYNWRGFFDFGTGQLGNWGIHTLGPVNLALQLGAPTSVEVLRRVEESKWAFPGRAVIKYDFPARGGLGPVSVYWHDSARPEDPEAYIHRAGRTGRAGASGVAISLVAGVEKFELDRIAKRFGIDLQERPLPADEDVELAIVKSPIVGTFYQASEPGARPFAQVGDVVKKGQVLCIIEAMKLMNEINAEVDGELVKVYVENGQAVQYGERLFAIRPA